MRDAQRLECHGVFKRKNDVRDSTYKLDTVMRDRMGILTQRSADLLNRTDVVIFATIGLRSFLDSFVFCVSLER